MDLSTLFSLTNKVALITGASKGIGFSIAEVFAAAGAKVVISSRNQESLDEMANNLKSKGVLKDEWFVSPFGSYFPDENEEL
jgi:NAD(P)-dependent dehydrogenase (short-subunit alcohol dehydrogenase family)